VTYPDQITVSRIIEDALEEDIGNGDLTSAAVLGEGEWLQLVMATREEIVVAGLDISAQIFCRLAPETKVQFRVKDADMLAPGTLLMSLDGPARGLLTAERTALNLVQTLSGIATETRRYVDAIHGTGVVLLDTRKTIPGLRVLSKYAAAIGGATNHRMRLDDGVLIKDNHVAVTGSVANAVSLAQKAGLKDIEVECDTLEQVTEALDGGADRILLDNMSNYMLSKAVKMTAGRASLEASGGVSLETVRAIAETGVDFISVGSITQSARAVDIGLDLTS
jgi:nicotinate-nucleotide pyrophosphorylase (carboxylating)